MMLAIATGLLNRVLTMKAAIANVARDGEARFRTLAEAIPHIVWTADPEGEVDYCNQRWYELTGLSETQSPGLAGPPVSIQTVGPLPGEIGKRSFAADSLSRWSTARSLPREVFVGTWSAQLPCGIQQHHREVVRGLH
jgi:PAS domain-containing protein